MCRPLQEWQTHTDCKYPYLAPQGHKKCICLFQYHKPSLQSNDHMYLYLMYMMSISQVCKVCIRHLLLRNLRCSWGTLIFHPQCTCTFCKQHLHMRHNRNTGCHPYSDSGMVCKHYKLRHHFCIVNNFPCNFSMFQIRMFDLERQSFLFQFYLHFLFLFQLQVMYHFYQYHYYLLLILIFLCILWFWF